MEAQAFSYRTMMRSDFQHHMGISLLEVIPEIYRLLTYWPLSPIVAPPLLDWSLANKFYDEGANLRRLRLVQPLSGTGLHSLEEGFWGDGEFRFKLRTHLDHWLTMHLVTLWEYKSIIVCRENLDSFRDVVLVGVEAARALIEIERPEFLPHYNRLLVEAVDFLSDTVP